MNFLLSNGFCLVFFSESYYRGAHGVMLVFDVTNLVSDQNVFSTKTDFVLLRNRLIMSIFG